MIVNLIVFYFCLVMIKNKQQQLLVKLSECVKRKAKTEANDQQNNPKLRQNYFNNVIRKGSNKSNAKTIQSVEQSKKQIKKSVIKNEQPIRRVKIFSQKEMHNSLGNENAVRKQGRLNKQKIAINGKNLNKHFKSFKICQNNSSQLHYANQDNHQNYLCNGSITVQNEQQQTGKVNRRPSCTSDLSLIWQDQVRYKKYLSKGGHSLLQSPVHAVRNFVDRQIIKNYAGSNHCSQQKLHHYRAQQAEEKFKTISRLNEQEDHRSCMRNTKIWQFRKYFNQKYNSRQSHSRNAKNRRKISQDSKNLADALYVSNHIYALCNYRNMQIHDVIKTLGQKAKSSNGKPKISKTNIFNRQKQRRISQFDIVTTDKKQSKQQTIQPWEVY